MSADPNGPDGEESNSGSLVSIILAVVISVIVIYLVMANSRRHASSVDEGTPPAATETAPAPAAAPAPAQPTTTP